MQLDIAKEAIVSHYQAVVEHMTPSADTESMMAPRIRTASTASRTCGQAHSGRPPLQGL
jgi:hypothetical protein